MPSGDERSGGKAGGSHQVDDIWGEGCQSPLSDNRRVLRGGPSADLPFPQVQLARTEGQLFRERAGFIILCVIGAYCFMKLLIELKSILEPFLWAVFLVGAWKPVVDGLERQIARSLATLCGTQKPDRELAGNRSDGELQGLVSDSELDVVPPIGSAFSDIDDVDTSWRSRSRFHDIDIDEDDNLQGRMRLAIARGLAVLVALAGTLGVLSGFGFLMLESARRMKNHWDVYRTGAHNLGDEAVSLLGYLFQKVPESVKRRYEDVTGDVLKTAQDMLYGLVGDLVNNISSLLFGGLLTLLYTLFWLCSPVPMDNSVDVMFRKYIMFKTLTCFGFGICVGLLLAFLSIDLASVFALTTFALNYVPEVGPFIAMVLPVPVILLDSRLERPLLVLITAICGQLALKFAFSNIVEVKLIESDKKLRMHPVMILLSVGIFGYLWGPTGMLLSVPLMALMKIALFSDLVPASYRDPILVLLEGDRNAPQRHGLKASRGRTRPRRACRGEDSF
mmetsp:Transcript_8006/g.17854  ORF Transcript_8006/g.17854 Transcript_8006/m.17854 type:complete len:505 (-) Transcript_8006:72-1586(-)